jgi:outer membrane protein OmpA-like peptidoglycan-associated protein
MKNLLFPIILLTTLALSACSTSRVILLENNKKNNAIVVTTKSGELVLNEVNTYTDISSMAPPAEVKTLTTAELEHAYGTLIATAPKAPIHFLLYFEPNTIILTSASEELFPEIREAIRERIPCDVNIIGHADRTGSKQYNIDLSLKRARHILQWLTSQNLNISNITVESYGEEDPLIPTADEIPEPRNRRVEILIR